MSLQSIQEIKQSLDIVSVIGADVELRQRGSSYWGLCSLHDDRTPSLQVKDNRFKCWAGCGSGDAIDYVQLKHDLSFMDALKFLGIEPGPVTPEVRADIQRRQRRRELIRRFRQWENKKADHIATLLRNCRRLVGKIQTLDDLDKYGDLYHMIPQLEYELEEILCSRDDRLKFEYYKEELKHAGF